MQSIEVKRTEDPVARLEYVDAEGVDVYPILETDDLCWVKIKMKVGSTFHFDGRDAVKLLYRVSGQGTVRIEGNTVVLSTQERLVIPEGSTTKLEADNGGPTEDILLMGMNQIAGALFNTFRGSSE